MADDVPTGEEIKALLAISRKRAMSFGLCLGKKPKDTVLIMHRSKSPEVLMRTAKKAGETPKVTCGKLETKGKKIKLSCEKDAPAGLAKNFRRYLQTVPMKATVTIVNGSGDVLDEDFDEEDEDQATASPPAEEQPAEVSEPETVTAPGEGGDEVDDKGGAGAAPVEEEDKTGALLLKAFGTMKAELQDKMATASREQKVIFTKIVKQFSDANKAKKYDEAKKSLSSLKKALAKAVPEETGFFEDLKNRVEDVVEDIGDVAGDVGDVISEKLDEAKEDLAEFAGEVKDTIEEVVETVGEAAGDFVGIYSDEDQAQLDKLDGFGLSQEARVAVMQANRDNPKAVDEALAAVKTMTASKVPPRDMERLLKLKTDNPKTYDSAVAAMKALDPAGGMDVSSTAMTASLKSLQAARKELHAKLVIWQAKAKAVTDADKVLKAAQAEQIKKKADMDKAAADLAAFKTAHPDLSTLSAADQTKLTALEGVLTTTTAAHATAQTATSAAVTAKTAAESAKQTATTAYFAAKTPVDTAEATQKKLDEKRALLDALNFGVLSGDAEKPLDDESKAKLIETYAKSPALGEAAFDLVEDAKDPALIVKNIGFIGDKMTDGFADKDGNAIGASAADKETMAINALKMGAREGQDYFDGFKDYLDTGAQRVADPTGGDAAAVTPWKKERARQAEINTKRSAKMADAVIGSDGKVDFTSEDSKKAMDHMMFHPGSLKIPAPAMIDQMRDVRDNFADATLGPKMQTALDATALPDASTPEGARQRQTAGKIVGGTVDKAGGSVTDGDAKEAVMAAMMTPLSQGPVGSCFTTAAVRKVREQDPERAMKEYSAIASTGMFKAANGKSYPANTTPPAGENPLMRSWEYSVASAASSETNSYNRGKMNTALFDSSEPGNLNQLNDPALMGADWDDKTAADGSLEPGIRSKLRTAIRTKLTFNYNAGPAIGSVGGGDGRSESGVFEVMYNRKALTKEKDFLDAIGEIALDVCSETKVSVKGVKILAIVNDPAFVDMIIKSGGGSYKPWEDAGGAFGRETTKVLEGGNPREDEFLSLETTGQDPGERTRELLDKLGGIGDDRALMWTMGSDRGANHVFALLPDDPTFAALKSGDMAANINEKLLEPGKKIANSEIKTDEAVRMFEKEVRRAARSWGRKHPDLLELAIEKKPDEDMKPGELKEHIATVLEDTRKAVETQQLDDWKAAQSPAPTATQIADKQKLIEENTQFSVSSGIDTSLAEKFDPPEVVVADTNWGGSDSHTYFVIAPDPSTGELKMWNKDSISGKLTPAEDIWADAQWAEVKP